MIDLTQLRAFAVIAREGNLTRAAERLHLTQSAVSLQIKNLQERLKVSLFSRTARGLALTAEGLALLPLAEKILDSVTDLERHAGHLQHVLHGTLALGTILNPESIRLGAVLQYLVEHFPALRTQLTHGMSGAVLDQLRSGSLDAGFYLCPSEEKEPPADILFEKLMPIRYYVVAPKGWQQRVRGKSWAQVASLPWVWTPATSVHHRMLARKFSSLRVEPSVVAQVDLEASMLNLVKAGVGLSLARDSLALEAAHTEGIVVLHRLALSADLSFVASLARGNDPTVKAAFDAVRHAFA